LASARALAEEVENLARQYLALRAAGLAPVLLAPAGVEEGAAGLADHTRAGGWRALVPARAGARRTPPPPEPKRLRVWRARGARAAAPTSVALAP